MVDMDKLTFAERSLLRALVIKNDVSSTVSVRVYNARKNYPNLNIYRALERAGKIKILTVDNATTENMLYGMSTITFVLER